MTQGASLPEAVEYLAGFLAARPLTAAIADLEHRLDGREAADVEALTRATGVDDRLLTAAIVVRANLGRISDLIHAAAIVLVLPQLLEDGERIVNRPSLAAGNDPTRPYDLETNLRVAEFKLSRWVGADAMRKRQTFKDLVHLAADTSGRQPELFVVGEAPAKFFGRRNQLRRGPWTGLPPRARSSPRGSARWRCRSPTLPRDREHGSASPI